MQDDYVWYFKPSLKKLVQFFIVIFSILYLIRLCKPTRKRCVLLDALLQRTMKNYVFRKINFQSALSQCHGFLTSKQSTSWSKFNLVFHRFPSDFRVFLFIYSFGVFCNVQSYTCHQWLVNRTNAENNIYISNKESISK